MFDQIVQSLKKSPDYVSGEELSRGLKISRAAVWKYIRQLRALGYGISAVPHLGYRLDSVPDKILPWEIRQGLKTKVCGKKVLCFETVRSTMDEAFAMGMRGEPEGTVICAEGQTKGRGRLGRVWVSPKGKGVYFSILLRPKLPPARVAEMTLLNAVAVCEAVNNTAGISARIKWPNDIVIDHRKLGGILTEMSAEMDRVKFVVVGIGINVSPGHGKLAANAVSLKDVSDRDFSRIDLVREILRSLDQWYEVIHHEGVEPVIGRWKELSLTLGNRVRIVEPGSVTEGEALDLDKDGGLLVRTAGGRVVKKMTGDVQMIRIG